MAIDASLIEADANKQNSTPKEDWDPAQVNPADAPRAVREYLDTLDEAVFGAASEVRPKFTSHSDPASQWTAARKGPAFISYSDNDLIDTDHGVIVDVEATRSIRQAEVGSTKIILERVKAKFDLQPERLIADTAYGTAPMLERLVDRKIALHIPVFDKSGRSDGTWTRADFEWDAENNQYICPEGQELKQFRRNYSKPNRGPTGKGVAKYRCLKHTCKACPSKSRCCPNMDFRSITREEHEDARQVARDIAKTEQYVISMKLRKKVEMLFAHLKRILGLNRLRFRGPCGANPIHSREYSQLDRIETDAQRGGNSDLAVRRIRRGLPRAENGTRSRFARIGSIDRTRFPPTPPRTLEGGAWRSGGPASRPA